MGSGREVAGQMMKYIMCWAEEIYFADEEIKSSLRLGNLPKIIYLVDRGSRIAAEMSVLFPVYHLTFPHRRESVRAGSHGE